MLRFLKERPAGWDSGCRLPGQTQPCAPGCMTGPGFPLFMPGGLLHRVTVKWEGAGLLVRMLPGT